MRNFFIAKLVMALFLIIMGFSPLSFSQSTSLQSKFTEEISPRVVGGEKVKSEKVYPWMVRVYIDFPANKLGRCGATIIDEEWVLTAAHCLHYDDVLVSDASKVSLIIGEYDISKTSSSEQERTASEIIVHSDFDIQDPFLKNDIALIRLSNTTQGASLIALGSVTVTNNTDLPGDTLRIMGWGMTNSQTSISMPNVLNSAEVKNIALSKCKTTYSGLSNAHICAGFYDDGGVDSCAGDSGGPLVFNNGGQWVQVGIVSFGRGCAQAKKPGIYTNVTKYIPWIQSTINSKKSMMRLAVIEGSSIALVAGSGNLKALPEPEPNVEQEPEVVVAPVASGGGGGGGGGGSTGLVYFMLISLILLFKNKHKF